MLQMVMKNRVMKQDLSKNKPQKSLDNLEMIDVLPGKDVIETIKEMDSKSEMV